MSQAILGGDLVRLCWRLWALGVPTALLIPPRLVLSVQPFLTVPGLVRGDVDGLTFVRSKGFPWSEIPPFCS